MLSVPVALHRSLQVPVRNVHKTYLSHKAAMGLISKDAEKEGAVKIMGRLQITRYAVCKPLFTLQFPVIVYFESIQLNACRFTKEGWMLSDADDNAHECVRDSDFLLQTFAYVTHVIDLSVQWAQWPR